jgi:hypothetical protein
MARASACHPVRDGHTQAPQAQMLLRFAVLEAQERALSRLGAAAPAQKQQQALLRLSQLPLLQVATAASLLYRDGCAVAQAAAGLAAPFLEQQQQTQQTQAQQQQEGEQQQQQQQQEAAQQPEVQERLVVVAMGDSGSGAQSALPRAQGAPLKAFAAHLRAHDSAPAGALPRTCGRTTAHLRAHYVHHAAAGAARWLRAPA